MLIASCASHPEPGFVSQFERSGRFVAQVVASGEPAESVQGGFRWRQAEYGWQLDLLGPLGNTLARLDASPGVVVLQRPGNETRSAPTASALVADLFGAQVPVDALADWLGGHIQDDARVQNVQYDEQGRVVSLRQDGWEVRFDRYDGAGPRLMEISGVELGRTVILRMVVDSAHVSGSSREDGHGPASTVS